MKAYSISMYRMTPLMKVISLVVAFIFIFTSTTFAIPRTMLDVTQSKGVQSVSKEAELTYHINPAKFLVPENFGMVTERFISSGTKNAKKLIIQIQDSHCNYEAQKNISKMIQIMATDKSTAGALKMISVEGSQGVANFDYERSFPNREIRSQTSDYFMKIGWLTGPELYEIDSKDKPLLFFGAEDKDLYEKNLDYFLKSKKDIAREHAFIDKVLSVIAVLKRKIFSKAMLNLAQKRQEWDGGILQFTDYCGYIDNLALKHGFGEKGAKYFSDKKKYPNFTAVMESIDIENKINPKKIQSEREAIVSHLQKKMVKEELSELVKQSLHLRIGKITSDMFYNYLNEVVINKKIDMKKYPNLKGYMQIVKLNSVLDAGKLFGEVDRIENAIKNKMFKNREEKELDLMIKQVNIMKNLLNLRMSRRDLSFYDNNKKDMTADKLIRKVGKLAKKTGISSDLSGSIAWLKANKNIDVSVCEEFYKAALARDKVLVENTIKEMGRTKANAVAVVSGGFHTQGMKELFKGKGYSYVVVTPRMTKAYNDKIYLSRMLNKQTEFDKIFGATGTRLSAWTMRDKLIFKKSWATELALMAEKLGDFIAFRQWIFMNKTDLGIDIVEDKDGLKIVDQSNAKQVLVREGKDGAPEITEVSTMSAKISEESGVDKGAGHRDITVAEAERLSDRMKSQLGYFVDKLLEELASTEFDNMKRDALSIKALIAENGNLEDIKKAVSKLRLSESEVYKQLQEEGKDIEEEAWVFDWMDFTKYVVKNNLEAEEEEIVVVAAAAEAREVINQTDGDDELVKGSMLAKAPEVKVHDHWEEMNFITAGNKKSDVTERVRAISALGEMKTPLTIKSEVIVKKLQDLAVDKGEPNEVQQAAIHALMAQDESKAIAFMGEHSLILVMDQTDGDDELVKGPMLAKAPVRIPAEAMDQTDGDDEKKVEPRSHDHWEAMNILTAGDKKSDVTKRVEAIRTLGMMKAPSTFKVEDIVKQLQDMAMDKGEPVEIQQAALAAFMELKGELPAMIEGTPSMFAKVAEKTARIKDIETITNEIHGIPGMIDEFDLKGREGMPTGFDLIKRSQDADELISARSEQEYKESRKKITDWLDEINKKIGVEAKNVMQEKKGKVLDVVLKEYAGKSFKRNITGGIPQGMTALVQEIQRRGEFRLLTEQDIQEVLEKNVIANVLANPAEGNFTVKVMMKEAKASEVTRPGVGSTEGYVNEAILNAYNSYAENPDGAVELILNALSNMEEDEYLVNLVTAIDILSGVNRPNFNSLIDYLLAKKDSTDHSGLKDEIKPIVDEILAAEEELLYDKLAGKLNGLKLTEGSDAEKARDILVSVIKTGDLAVIRATISRAVLDIPRDVFLNDVKTNVEDMLSPGFVSSSLGVMYYSLIGLNEAMPSEEYFGAEWKVISETVKANINTTAVADSALLNKENIDKKEMLFHHVEKATDQVQLKMQLKEHVAAAVQAVLQGLDKRVVVAVDYADWDQGVFDQVKEEVFKEKKLISEEQKKKFKEIMEDHIVIGKETDTTDTVVSEQEIN